MSSRASVRASTLGAIALGVALVGFAACSDDDGAGSGQQDAGAGGVAGTAAGAGSGGTGASGGSSGTGATSGAGGDGGQWGSYPVWEPIPGGALDCKFERLTNAAAVTVFKWQPCPSDVGCEQALLNPGLVSTDPQFAGSTVHDDGMKTRVGLHFITPFDLVLVTSAEGVALDGFRPVDVNPKCRLSGAKIWKQRLATLIAPWSTLDRFAGLVVTIGDGTPTFFEAPQPLPPGAPAPHALGDARWLWWWAPKNSLTSVSASDGSGFAHFAKVEGMNLLFNSATSTGPAFLFSHYYDDGGSVSLRISHSDGLAEPAPYLVAPAGSHFGSPAYAHSHVAFLRGIGPLDLNKYESVELWVSPFSTDPQGLEPQYVATLPYLGIGPLAGGWGYAALADELPANDAPSVDVWKLQDKVKRSYPLPSGQLLGDYLGISRSHFWMGSRIKGKSGNRHLLRYALE